MKFGNILITLVFLLLITSVSAQISSTKRVILVTIGGVSAEGFQYADTPEINSLISQGVISLKTRGVMPTQSAPNLASLLTGAGPEQHGVTSNSWSLVNQGFEPTAQDADGYFTSIFTLIRKQKPNANTAMFYDWEWLGTCINKKYISKEQYIQGQVMITSVALNFLKKENPVFTFIYYGLPDRTGRSKGYESHEYFQSITEIDTEIGKIIAGVKEMGMAQGTTFIITSDHGDSGIKNGTESMSEIEVPWIVSGPGIKKNILLETPNDQFNTAPTIAKVLGIKTPDEWIGKPALDIFLSKTPSRKTNIYIPKPFCSLQDGAFKGPQLVELSTTAKGSEIYYTLDGTNPGVSSLRYTDPFTIRSNCTMKAVCISGKYSSQTTIRMYTFEQGVKSANLTFEPSQNQPGLGISGLFDGLIGSSNPGNKQWMGFEGTDFEVNVDLGEVKPVNTMGLDVLKFQEKSILIPATLQFYSSVDGTTYNLLSTYYPSESGEIRPDGPAILLKTFKNLNTRYIRVKATNIGICPPGLPCEGQKAWIFVSEVEIE